MDRTRTYWTGSGNRRQGRRGDVSVEKSRNDGGTFMLRKDAKVTEGGGLKLLQKQRGSRQSKNFALRCCTKSQKMQDRNCQLFEIFGLARAAYVIQLFLLRHATTLHSCNCHSKLHLPSIFPQDLQRRFKILRHLQLPLCSANGVS